MAQQPPVLRAQPALQAWGAQADQGEQVARQAAVRRRQLRQARPVLRPDAVLQRDQAVVEQVQERAEGMVLPLHPLHHDFRHDGRQRPVDAGQPHEIDQHRGGLAVRCRRIDALQVAGREIQPDAGAEPHGFGHRLGGMPDRDGIRMQGVQQRDRLEEVECETLLEQRVG